MLTSTSFLPIFNAFNSLLLSTSLRTFGSPSTTIKNKKEARRSPCLKPFSRLNSKVRLPLTKTDTIDDIRHLLIHLIHLELKPKPPN